MSVEELHIKFQGGFIGKTCIMQAGNSVDDLEDLFSFYPEDISSLQVSNIIITTVCLLPIIIVFP